MVPNADYKPVLSVSISPDQCQPFYTSLAQFRQRFPFTTTSALVVQAVIAASHMEQQVIGVLAHLPRPVQITQQGSAYLLALWDQSRISPQLARSDQASSDHASRLHAFCR